MKWTSEPPTQEGWYFIRQSGQHMGIRRVLLYCDSLVAFFGPVKQSVEFMAKTGTQWAGPIPEPTEPEEMHNAD